MGDDQQRTTDLDDKSAVVVSSVEDSGRPFPDTEIPELEFDESIPPRPEEEIADALRSERKA